MEDKHRYLVYLSGKNIKNLRRSGIKQTERFGQAFVRGDARLTCVCVRRESKVDGDQQGRRWRRRTTPIEWRWSDGRDDGRVVRVESFSTEGTFAAFFLARCPPKLRWVWRISATSVRAHETAKVIF
jgi:hypothetical protein